MYIFFHPNSKLIESRKRLNSVVTSPLKQRGSKHEEIMERRVSSNDLPPGVK